MAVYGAGIRARARVGAVGSVGGRRLGFAKPHHWWCAGVASPGCGDFASGCRSSVVATWGVLTVEPPGAKGADNAPSSSKSGHWRAPRGMMVRRRLVRATPSARPSRAWFSSNGGRRPRGAREARSGSHPHRASDGPSGSRGESPLPGNEVSTRVLVTTSRLQRLARGIFLTGGSACTAETPER